MISRSMWSMLPRTSLKLWQHLPPSTEGVPQNAGASSARASEAVETIMRTAAKRGDFTRGHLSSGWGARHAPFHRRHLQRTVLAHVSADGRVRRPLGGRLL